MQNSNIMVRFLDLTLILLLSFLFAADLATEHEVTLPHGREDGGDSGTPPMTLSIAESDWRLMSGRRVVCSGRGISGLDDCLQKRGVAQQILVAPQSGVQVQRLVNVLDACARTATVCAPIAP